MGHYIVWQYSASRQQWTVYSHHRGAGATGGRDTALFTAARLVEKTGLPVEVRNEGEWGQLVRAFNRD
jgi:hypothetical protein